MPMTPLVSALLCCLVVFTSGKCINPKVLDLNLDMNIVTGFKGQPCSGADCFYYDPPSHKRKNGEVMEVRKYVVPAGKIIVVDEILQLRKERKEDYAVLDPGCRLEILVLNVGSFSFGRIAEDDIPPCAQKNIEEAQAKRAAEPKLEIADELKNYDTRCKTTINIYQLVKGEVFTRSFVNVRIPYAYRNEGALLRLPGPFVLEEGSVVQSVVELRSPLDDAFVPQDGYPPRTASCGIASTITARVYNSTAYLNGDECY